VTKVDICPAHVLEHTLATLSAILRKPGVRLKPFMVRAAPALPPACVMGTCLLHCSGCTAGKGAVMAHARAQVRSRDDVLTCARHMHTATLAPVLLTSAVTGDGLDLVRLFYNLLPLRQRWAERARSRPVPTALPGH